MPDKIFGERLPGDAGRQPRPLPGGGRGGATFVSTLTIDFPPFSLQKVTLSLVFLCVCAFFFSSFLSFFRITVHTFEFLLERTSVNV